MSWAIVVYRAGQRTKVSSVVGPFRNRGAAQAKANIIERVAKAPTLVVPCDPSGVAAKTFRSYGVPR